MGKYLLLLLLAVAAYLIWKALRRSRDAPPRARDTGEIERMVDCSQCGVHLPLSEAVGESGRYFCSDEHRRLFRR